MTVRTKTICTATFVVASTGRPSSAAGLNRRAGGLQDEDVATAHRFEKLDLAFAVGKPADIPVGGTPSSLHTACARCSLAVPARTAAARSVPASGTCIQQADASREPSAGYQLHEFLALEIVLAARLLAFR